MDDRPEGPCPEGPAEMETCLAFHCTTDLRQGEGTGIAWNGGSSLVGKQSAIREGHARESVARHQARACGATPSARARTALSSERAPSALIATDGGHRVPRQEDRRVHRRLLLARMSRALRPVEVEPRVLDTKDRCECRAGPRDDSGVIGGRVDGAPILESRPSGGSCIVGRVPCARPRRCPTARALNSSQPTSAW